MSVSESGPGYSFVDRPLPVFLPAALFAAGGIAFLMLGIREATGDAPALTVAGVTGMAIVLLAASIWIGSHAEEIRVDIDPATRRVRLRGRLLWRRRSHAWSFAEIDDVIAEKRRDDDGDRMWRPALLLADGTSVPMMANWRHDEEFVAAVRRSARQALGKG